MNTKKSSNLPSNSARRHSCESLAKLLGKSRKSGKNWLCLCPAHPDTKPSLSIAHGENDRMLFYCHAGCAYEDIVAALEARGISLSNRAAADRPKTRKTQSDPENDWKPLLPIPIEATPPPFAEFGSNAWCYKNEKGAPLFFIVRNDLANGSGKQYYPWTYCENADGDRQWRKLGISGKKPLFNLDQLCVRTDQRVVIVEGEKSSDAAQSLFPDHVAVTSANGAAAAHKTDWSPVNDRDVIIWPDADEAGKNYAQIVADLSSEAGARTIGIVQLPDTLKNGWDLADPIPVGMSHDDLRRLLHEAHEKHSASDTIKGEELPDSIVWPDLNSNALLGVAGEFVAAATKQSEASPVAVLITLLARFASAVGRFRYVPIADAEHHARLFAGIVGASARSRKGTSAEPVNRLFDHISQQKRISDQKIPLAPPFTPGPLGSGEGIVHALRDPSSETNAGGEAIDPGVSDKRLFVLEGELSGPLSTLRREGSTLSSILRTAWDGTDLAPVTKRNRIKATQPHLCLVGHITIDELHKLLRVTEIRNGFANRFLWFIVRRPKKMANPVPIPTEQFMGFVHRISKSIELAHARNGPMVMSAKAQELWEATYKSDRLEPDIEGVVADVTNRGPAQVKRLALTYALLEGATEIGVDHIRAALALWDYAFESAKFIFGDQLADPFEAKVYALLKYHSNKTAPMSLTELHNDLNRHTDKHALRQALKSLQGRGKVIGKKITTRGRDKQVFWVV